MRTWVPVALALTSAACIPSSSEPQGFDVYSDGPIFAHDDLIYRWDYTFQQTQYATSAYTLFGAIDVYGDGEPIAWFAKEGRAYAGPSIDDRGFFVFPADGSVHTLTETGVLWDSLSVTEGTVSTAPSIGEDGTIYVASDAGEVIAVARDGDVLWRTETPGTPFNRLAVDEEGRIVGFAAGTTEAGVQVWTAFAVSATGALLWATEMPTPLASPALSQRGHALAVVRAGPPDAVLTNPDDYRIVAYNMEDGAIEWEGVTGLPGYSPVVMANGDIVVAINDEGEQTGYVAFFNDRNGNNTGRSAPLGWVGQPAVGSDGRIYLGCEAQVCEVNGNGVVKRRHGLDDGDQVLASPLLHRGWLAAPGIGAIRLSGGTMLQTGTWARLGHDARGTGFVGTR